MVGVSTSPRVGRPCLGAGFVDVEGADDDHVGGRREVTLGHRNLLADVLAHHVDVVLELRRDGNHGRAVRDGSLNELADGVVLVRLHAQSRPRLLHTRSDLCTCRFMEIYGDLWRFMETIQTMVVRGSLKQCRLVEAGALNCVVVC